MTRRKPASVRVPLMSAFRGAAQARDATKVVDLRDEAGERVLPERRVVGRSPFSEAMLQEEVVRDLVILLNTTNLESTVDLEGYESVRRSILNYGIPDIAHRTIDELGVADIAAEIEQALMQFEPRLARESLRVERDLRAEASELKLRFLVRADLLSDPLNVPVEFFAEVQADSGKIVVGRA